ncbi:severin [Endogone sp. FLAS-F59071]|nr:severin [Endogone sp. FLAS-F59071]|eukprot:RUS19790.1 severin [Endogone sp. FLAS-F59071]
MMPLPSGPLPSGPGTSPIRTRSGVIDAPPATRTPLPRKHSHCQLKSTAPAFSRPSDLHYSDYLTEKSGSNMSGLVKQSTWKIEDTNLANFGTDLERKVHHEEGAKEAAWAASGSPVGKEAGLWIWRIEQFKVVAWPKNQYGKFYSDLTSFARAAIVGDSYIVLRSIKKKDSNVLLHDIHFWLGLETSQDEAGTAAFKTVELDDYLNGIATQHREVQSYESALFHSYFPHIVLLSGGVASGFHHWAPETHVTRLLRVHRPAALKGTHSHNAVAVTEVQLRREELSSGAVFVLDAGDRIWQFQGRESQGVEKAKAAEYVANLVGERDGKAKSFVIDEGDFSGAKDFWAALGAEPGPIASTSAGIAEAERHNADAIKKLFRLKNTLLGGLHFEEVAEGKITGDQFDTHGVFVLDVGHQVFAWIGAKADLKEKKVGLQYAQEYLQKHSRPAFTPITRVPEGAEDDLFESVLDSWKGW